jgi:ABC-type transport system substrate-binding protein
MRTAGYAYDPQTGVGGWPKPIVYPLYDGGLLVSTAQLLQQDLAKIGLRLSLKLVTYPTFLALQERPDGAAMSQANWGMDYPDASAFFDPLFTSSAIGQESTYNTAFFSNARFDDRVARAHHETDSVVRRALYREANEILCDQAPWAFAFAYHFYDVRQPYVRGLAHSTVRPIDVSRVWLDDTAGALPRGLSERLP